MYYTNMIQGVKHDNIDIGQFELLYAYKLFKIIRLKDYNCPFLQMQETRSFDVLIRSND